MHLDAYLGGADVRVENGSDVADPSGEKFVGIGAHANIRVLSQMNVGEIVFKDIAQDPDAGQVGDGERVRGALPLDAGGVRDLLIGYHARDWRKNINDRAR